MRFAQRLSGISILKYPKGSAILALAGEDAEAGFTLLEVLIAMFIMMFIGIAIYQMTTKTFELRDVLSNEGDFYNGIRLSMQVFQRDVSLIYSPTQILPNWPPAQPGAPGSQLPPEFGGAQPAPPPPAQNQNPLLDINQGENAQTLEYWGPMVDQTGIRPMHFIGTDTKMSFVSVSHIRIYKDTPESEFAKVKYELVKDEHNDDVKDAQLLVKTESPNVWEDEERNDKLRKVFPILHGIKKLRFRYWRKDKGQTNFTNGFVTSWDSDKEDTKNIYPDMIEVTIEVHGPSNLEFDGTYYLRPEVPLSGIPASG